MHTPVHLAFQYFGVLRVSDDRACGFVTDEVIEQDALFAVVHECGMGPSRQLGRCSDMSGVGKRPAHGQNEAIDPLCDIGSSGILQSQIDHRPYFAAHKFLM
jgi:hypothetical protein